MHDHNSLTESMVALYRAFLEDVESLTGIDTTAEQVKIVRVAGASGRSGLLAFLGKHHLVFLDRLQEMPLEMHGTANDGEYPLFLNALWRSDTLQSWSLLRQATSLLRKWGDDSVEGSADLEKFADRQRRRAPYDRELVKELRAQLKYIIGPNDLDVRELTLPNITTGARATKVPILRRIDTMVDSSIFRDFAAAFPVSRVGKQHNRAVSVPKDWEKNRLVFAEPNGQMNMQQCIRIWLESRISEHSYSRLPLHEQEKQHDSMRLNRRATLDLSDASDYVRSPLIWELLRDYPRLRSACFWARSSHTTMPDGTVLALDCFGTMGNALTFVMMSILLATVTRLAEKDAHSYTKLRPRPSTVFGDDIVCDDFIAGTVVGLLTRCGLVVNRRKSYIGKRFRESCGLDLLDGDPITPVYIKHLDIRSRDDVARTVSQSNALHRAGLWRAAAALTRLISEDVSVNVDSGSLFSFARDRLTTGCYYNCDLQTYVSRILKGRRTIVKRRDSTLDLLYTLCHGSRVTDSQRRAAF